MNSLACTCRKVHFFACIVFLHLKDLDTEFEYTCAKKIHTSN